MTFAELKQELSDRGFAHLSDTRRGRLVNHGRAELDRMFLWPWREASITGIAPLVVSDLGRIEAVVDTSQSSTPLARIDYRTLLDIFGDLSTAGTPECYYEASPAGVKEVATYPVSATAVIGVQYWKRTLDLSGPADVPASPEEAHLTIVDLAVRRGYRDSGDHKGAASLQPEIDNAIAQLLEQYPPGTPDGPDGFVGVTFASEDW